MRRGFTMIELIFSLVIIAVIASVGTDVIRLVFERYVASRDLERGQSDVRRTLDLLAIRLQYRIKDSAIARNGNDIVALEDQGAPARHGVLEWVGIAYESQRTSGGWSGFLDGTLVDQEANWTAIVDIEAELTGDGNPFGNRQTVLVFAGTDGRGERNNSQNAAYGWHGGEDSGNPYHEISLNSLPSLTLIPLADGVIADDWQLYFLARSAYAVWVQGTDLVMAYNYRPWRGENYQNHGTHTVLLENVTTFHFRESGGVLRLILCVSLPDGVMGDTVEYCRERSVL